MRDKQLDPPPPGSYRGVASGEEFTAAAQAATAGGPRPGFEAQLARLDDLKARGRITEDEYATMRRRLVEGVTPATLAPDRPGAAAPAADASAAPRSLAGRWYGRDRSVLDLRGAGEQIEWDWELATDRLTARANGTGSASGDRVSLVGRVTGFAQGGSGQTLSFVLTWDGAVPVGTSTGARNLEFRRDRP
ncbi:MAG TPA: SHOCT domain-containing protein [Verrucomicrobiae bacterium]|nr:SHOCT domain-containing protein [Verrucomicrobiae bacterium]